MTIVFNEARVFRLILICRDKSNMTANHFISLSRSLFTKSLVFWLVMILCMITAQTPFAESQSVNKEISKSTLDKHHFSSDAGVMVLRLQSGKILFESSSDKLLAPASLMKLVTSWSALTELGPDFSVSTLFNGELGSSPGVLRRLVITGGGAPDVTSESLYIIASLFRRRGIHQIDEIVVDTSRFKGGPQIRGERAYEAGSSSLLLNFNAVGVEVCPAQSVGTLAQSALEPAEYGRVIKGEVRTVPGSGNNINLHIPSGNGNIRIDGAIGINAQCRTVYRSVPEPEVYFAQTLVGFLQSVKHPLDELDKSVIRVSASPIDTSKMKFFQEYRSKPLVAFVADMNTFSNNVIAEQLVHLVGKEDEMFDYERGRARMNEVIKNTFKSEVVIRDGSGLNRENRLSASLLAHLIRSAILSPQFGVEFERSLAVTGRTGTLSSRKFSIPPYHLRAKTGSLTGVNALAGTLVPYSGEKIVFAIIQNSTKSRSRALEEERRFLESLYKNY